MKFLTSFSVISLIVFTANCNPSQNKVISQHKDSIYTYSVAGVDGTGKFYFGREIAPVMGASGAAWLERDERQKEENTKLAISKIDIPANGAIADIGAGTGYYTFK